MLLSLCSTLTSFMIASRHISEEKYPFQNYDNVVDVQNPFNVSFSEFAKAATSNGYPIPFNSQYQQFISKAQSVGSISSKREAAMFLAQVFHESQGLLYKSELGCPGESKCLAYQYATWDPHNCGQELNGPCAQLPYDSQQLYYGRGYMQLSWPVNYDSASWSLYRSALLYQQPDKVLQEPIAWDTAFWYWKIFVHTDRTVSEQGWFGSATRAINGQLECSPFGNTDLARKRFAIYKKVYSAFSLEGEPIETSCY